MFEMIRRVFKIAGNSRGKIVAGIVYNILKSFFNGFMMFGVFWILLHLDGLSPVIIGQAFGVILGSVLGRFFFQWMYDRTMSGSGYDIFRDYRLEIGERLKQAPWDISQSKIWAPFRPCSPPRLPIWRGTPCWRLSR